ncbi:MAG TPA: hydrolase [Gemmatimonadaceae bacterium]|nr:hydrolase [Gemmatimonadaceae bacterium]
MTDTTNSANVTLDPKTTALVVIDLQQGIVGAQTAPYTAADVVERSARLAKRFREAGATVVLVHVDPGPNGVLFPRPLADIERPRMASNPDFATIVSDVGPEAGDVVVTKHSPSAFFATDLELQLRRRKIDTIVLCGIATNIGVEATARTGYEHGFNLVFASDAMTARDGELHEIVVRKFFPTIGRVRTAEEILKAMSS